MAEKVKGIQAGCAALDFLRHLCDLAIKGEQATLWLAHPSLNFGLEIYLKLRYIFSVQKTLAIVYTIAYNRNRKDVTDMAKDANVFARVDAGMKEQAEGILSQLGLPMSNAINLFLNQVVLRRGLPFEVTLPVGVPLALGSMTHEQIDAEIKKGVDACKNGQVKPAELAFQEIEAELGR